MTDQIRIAITDDDLLVLNLLRDFIGSQPGITVQLTTESGEELLAALRECDLLPDLLLVDLKMKALNGIEITQILKLEYPSIRVMVISSHYKSAFIGFMVKTGVAAFFPKGISPLQLVELIRKVHAQGYYFTEEQMEVLREQLSHKAPSPPVDMDHTLSTREMEIVQLICQQKTAKEIADLLFLSQSTVEGHKNNIFAKTGAKNLAGLVIYAIQHGIIDPDSLPVI
nr:response regulator transcription factor [uncultured Fluviicola sp.]